MVTDFLDDEVKDDVTNCAGFGIYVDGVADQGGKNVGAKADKRLAIGELVDDANDSIAHFARRRRRIASALEVRNGLFPSQLKVGQSGGDWLTVGLTLPPRGAPIEAGEALRSLALALQGWPL